MDLRFKGEVREKFEHFILTYMHWK